METKSNNIPDLCDSFRFDRAGRFPANRAIQIPMRLHGVFKETKTNKKSRERKKNLNQMPIDINIEMENG